MMSVSPIRNTTQAKSYYMDKDNYYLKNEGQKFSEWWGKGATYLGLSGQIDPERFQELLEGRIDDNTQIGLMFDGSVKHRPGFDITFSAPKSLSLLAYLGGDLRLITIHQNAVKTALTEIEKTCASARAQVNGETVCQMTQNLAVALFHHDTSRLLDPQMHTHAVVMNATLRDDNVWRALASQMGINSDKVEGFRERIYAFQIFFSNIYRLETAKHTKELGYDIKRVGPHGMWEVDAIPNKVLEAFSKRRQEILDAANGLSTPKANDIIAKVTRVPKQAADRNELKAYWINELKNIDTDFDMDTYVSSVMQSTERHGKQYNTQQHSRDSANPKTSTGNNYFDAQMRAKAMADLFPEAKGDLSKMSFSEIIEASRKAGVSKDNPVVDQAAMVVDVAIESMSHFSTSFGFEALFNKAASMAMGELRHADLKKNINERLQSGTLIAINHRGTRLSTAQLLKKEQDIIESMLSLKKESLRVKNLDGLSDTSQIALKNRISMINVSASRQFELLESSLQEIEAKGYKVHLLSPNRDNANDLYTNVHRDSSSLLKWFKNIGKPQIGQTVRGFAYQQSQKAKSPLAFLSQDRHVAVVDSAHKLSPDDLNLLLETAKRDGTRLLFLNNTKGLSASHDALGLLNKTHIAQSTIQTGDYNSQLIVGLSTQSMKLNIDHANTLVVTDSKKRIAPLTAEIRNELKFRGELSRDEIVVSSLKPKYIDHTRMSSKDFNGGDVLRVYHQNSPFEDFKIRGAITGEGVLNVETLSGKSKRIKLKSLRDGNFKLFESSELKLARSDKVRGTATMKKEGIEAYHHYRVTDISDKHLVLDDGSKQFKVSTQSGYLPLEHDYVRTIAQAAGSFDKVIVDAKAYNISSNLINELSAISHKIDIHTNDIEKATKTIERAVKREHAIDLVLKTHQDPTLLDASNYDAFKRTLTDTIESMVEVQNRDELNRALDNVIEHLSDREAAFEITDIFNKLVEFSLGEGNFAEIASAIEQRIHSSELMSKDNETFTTPKALAHERAVITHLNDGKGKMTPIMDADSVKVAVENTHLTSSQRQAVVMMLSSKDQFVAVQGFAGVGKSTMLAATQDISGEKILGLAPTHRAVFELQAKGIEAQTLKSFLYDMQGDSRPDIKGRLIVLDEASMVPNRDLDTFTKVIQDSGARAVIQGDMLQYQAIEAGKPWDIALTKSKADRVFCNEIVRQKNLITKKAVEASIEGNVAEAIRLLDIAPIDVERRGDLKAMSELCNRNVVSFEDIDAIINNSTDDQQVSLSRQGNAKINATILEAAANDYLSRTDYARANTVVVIDSHEDRMVVNELIREGLKQEGGLSRQTIKMSRLVNSGLTTAELRDIKHYKESDVVYIKGRYLEVDKIDRGASVVTLKDDQGNTSLLHPDRNANDLQLFKLEQAEIAKGDQLRLTKTDKKRGMIANAEYQVTDANSSHIQLAQLNGEQTLNLKVNDLKDQHWDYAYTTTGFSSQSLTRDSVIGVKFSWRKNLSSLRSLYVFISRAVNSATLYTDETQKLVKQLQETVDQGKTSAIETVTGERISSRLTKPLSMENNRSTSDNKTQVSISQKAEQQTHAPWQQEFPIDVNEVHRALAHDARDVAISILGEPNQKLSSGTQLKFGSKGSLSINIGGQYQGTFTNFETGESGNMIQLIQQELGLSFKETLKYAQKLTGGLVEIEVKPKPQFKVVNENKQDKLNWAHRVIDGSKPIKGTLAEQYLKSRHINKVSGRDLKFNPKVWVGKDEATGKNIYAPALVAIARDKQGSVGGLQMIYLDKDSGRKLDTDVQKRSLGNISGNAVLLCGNKDSGLSFIAEGPETGLSVQEAIKGAHVLATLGKNNMKNIDPEILGQHVVLLADKDDPSKGIKDDKTLLEAASRLKQAGKDVHIVMPEWLDGKTDMNDVLSKKGVDALRHTLSNTVGVKYGSDATPDLSRAHESYKRFTDEANSQADSDSDKLQRYHDSLHQQQKQSTDQLQKQPGKEAHVSPSVDQINRQIQLDREI